MVLSELGDRDIGMSAESDIAPVLHIERELRHLSAQITQPRAGECLHCYVYRVLEFGCAGLRWAKRYRDLKAPRATALDRRLMSKGAGWDCEIFMNGWSLRREYKVYDPEGEEYLYPEQLPECKGVRAGSVQPCGLWIVQSYRDWW
jgi:hypothetical protein